MRCLRPEVTPRPLDRRRRQLRERELHGLSCVMAMYEASTAMAYGAIGLTLRVAAPEQGGVAIELTPPPKRALETYRIPLKARHCALLGPPEHRSSTGPRRSPPSAGLRRVLRGQGVTRTCGGGARRKAPAGGSTEAAKALEPSGNSRRPPVQRQPLHQCHRRFRLRLPRRHRVHPDPARAHLLREPLAVVRHRDGARGDVRDHPP
jgi:hypothetical protein